VIPAASRLDRERLYSTPLQVLAFGDRSVGLWQHEAPAGRVTSIEIDRLLAIDDREILLYGHLRFVSAHAQIHVRYDTASREALEGSLCDLRRRMAPTEIPTEATFVWLDASGRPGLEADLPHKWRTILQFPTVRLDPALPSAVAVGDVAAAPPNWVSPAAGRPATGVAVLGPRELVVATEPGEFIDGPRYGVDLVSVPRERLGRLAWDGHSLTIWTVGRSDGEWASVTLHVDPELVKAMQRAFGTAVSWG
jgi:hypothetical protein